MNFEDLKDFIVYGVDGTVYVDCCTCGDTIIVQIISVDLDRAAHEAYEHTVEKHS